jgi:hypothetical protein
MEIKSRKNGSKELPESHTGGGESGKVQKMQ